MKYILILIIINSLVYFANSNEIKHEKKESKKSLVDTNKTYLSYLIDKEPQFPGGKDSLKKFLDYNLRYTGSQLEYQGLICVCFVVNRDGKIDNVFIPDKHLSVLFEKTFLELFKKMPRWIPGKLNGIKIKTRMCLPFSIQLF